MCFHTKTRADGLSAGSTMKGHWKLGKVSAVALSELLSLFRSHKGHA